MRRGNLLWVPAFLLLTVSAGFAQEEEVEQQAPTLNVESLVITSGIQDRMPVDTLTEVSGERRTVYCWTHITGADRETTIQHVWYRGDEEMGRIELRVASPDWRTWSSKSIQPVYTGEWRVEVLDPNGTLLDSVPFRVTEAEPGPGTEPQSASGRRM
jgi:hypothetical protein